MEKTIKYLEDTGFLKDLRNTAEIGNVLVEKITGEKCSEKARNKAYKDIIIKEISKNLVLLDIILNEVSDEIIKHI